jgi:hypothetical protein
MALQRLDGMSNDGDVWCPRNLPLASSNLAKEICGSICIRVKNTDVGHTTEENHLMSWLVVTSASHDLALAWHPVLSSSSPLLSSLFRRLHTHPTELFAFRSSAQGRDMARPPHDEQPTMQRSSPTKGRILMVQ